VTPTTARQWAESLAAAGWPHQCSGDLAGAAAAGRARPLAAFTAAREPLAAIDVDSVPWTERVVSTSIAGLELVNVHSPISPKPGLAKVRTHEAVFAHLKDRAGPRAVCGDLNTPRKEHPDGRVWTFARTQHGKLRPDRGERWDRAELALIRGLNEHGFRDAFRALHGPAVRELSWEWPRWGGGYRLDHLIVSADVSVERIEYRHDWRTDGLSDHSPLIAEMSWQGGAGVSGSTRARRT
jgi:exonuclease III